MMESVVKCRFAIICWVMLWSSHRKRIFLISKSALLPSCHYFRPISMTFSNTTSLWGISADLFEAFHLLLFWTTGTSLNAFLLICQLLLNRYMWGPFSPFSAPFLSPTSSSTCIGSRGADRPNGPTLQTSWEGWPSSILALECWYWYKLLYWHEPWVEEWEKFCCVPTDMAQPHNMICFNWLGGTGWSLSKSFTTYLIFWTYNTLLCLWTDLNDNQHFFPQIVVNLPCYFKGNVVDLTFHHKPSYAIALQSL